MDTEHGHEPRPIRYGPAMVLVGLFLAGLVVPFVLRDLAWYREFLLGLPPDARVLVHPVYRMVLVVVGWMVIRMMLPGASRITLGLAVGWKQGFKGVLIGLGCTLPMLALGMLCDRNTVDYTLLYGSLLPGLTEEIFYRAFAFGLLVQAARLKLWPAAIATGALFGLAHLIHASIRAEPIMEQVGWIGMIAIGGLLYAWIYERADWNLWVVVALHAGMNLWWDVFDLNSSMLGVTGATASRILAVGLAILSVVFRGVLRSRSTPTIKA